MRKIQQVMPNDRTIISLFGASGAGKSTLAKALKQHNPKLFARAPGDYYLVNRAEATSDFWPEYDWNHLREDLAKPFGTKIVIPGYNFEKWFQTEPKGDFYSIRDFIVIDSMLPYPGADLFIRLSLAEELRRDRIIERDKRWKSNVIADWDEHLKIVDKLNALDLEIALDLNGDESIEVNVGKVVELLES